MAKATLKFNLPEENAEHKLAVNAGNYYAVLWDIDQYLRGKLKHGDLAESEYVVLEKTRDELRDLMNTYNVTLDL